MSFTEELRKTEHFERAFVRKMTVDENERSAQIEIVTDKSYTDEDVENVNVLVERSLPFGYKKSVQVVKLVADSAMVRRSVMNILKTRFPALFAFAEEGDVSVECGDGEYRYVIKTIENSLIDLKDISDELEKIYCGRFIGENVLKKVDLGNMKIEEEEELIEYETPIRKFKICDFKKIETEKEHEYAIYVADLNFESESVAVCGKILDIQERETQAGKPYFSFTINDKSGSLKFYYFTRKATIDKIKQLKVGDSICAFGENSYYRNNLGFTAKHINYGSYPEGFVPEERPSKPAPNRYTVIYPEEYEDLEQADFFSFDELPECLVKNEFVVFDFETTGLINTPGSGATMDKIIEIGACKIREGRIVEKFSTFIDPHRRLSEEIIGLTGITDEMLVGAPPIEKVVPDFYKFCDGCYMVGHNVMFDYKFIDYYSKKEGYQYPRKLFDTWAIAQEQLFLKNYKLNTIADHYGISFNHHRAFDDALTTAKIFIRLIKAKKCLPNLI